MAKMTQNTYSALYEFGKRVYDGEFDIKTAAQQVCLQNPEVAMSSAKHYILWYSKMRMGEFLTWNSNSDLLLYYARRIINENGVNAGELAINSAIKFARHVSRPELERDLNHLAEENGINIELSSNAVNECTTQKTAFQNWLKNLKTHKYTDHVIYKYTRALEMAEEWLSIKLPSPIFLITKRSVFDECEKIIKSIPNYVEVNKAHGHGDLSAALSLYSKFLDYQINLTSKWWPTKEEYEPRIPKEKWLELLTETDVLGDNIRRMLAAMFKLGGAASCAQLSDIYGKTPSHYVMTAVHAAERTSKATGCPIMEGKEDSKFWPVLFVGRTEAKTDRYIWKIRDELYEALTEFNIEKYLPKKDTTEKIGIFDSWEIVNEVTAIKTCDKSFFDYNGSGVPKSICWFFEAEYLETNENKSLSLIYNGVTYDAKVQNDSTDHRRVRIFWNAELGKAFSSYKDSDVKAKFIKVSELVYEITIIGGEKEMTVKEKINAIKEYISTKGFNYEDDLIENFYLSLKSKPFVILAGTSGTGKTRLVKLFAEAIGAKMKLVPVRPDWSDSSDLFGHTDLSGNFQPGAIIDFIKQAEWNSDTPYFLCLDEMNLARVEYYLSDFLSVIETRDRKANGKIETDPLVDVDYYKDNDAKAKYGRVFIPENLYIVGTVNMDETTFPFSKKVLDRANTIEFSYVNLMSMVGDKKETVAQKLDNSFLKTDYLYLRDCDDSELIESICFDLEELNQILVKANLHVGYRVRDEISFYLMNNKKADLLSNEAAFDNEIMQKILPRVQGSSAAIKDVLSELFIKCAGDYTGFSGISAYEQMESYIESKECKYPNSAKKIKFMMRRYEEDGFTSYWL